MKYHKHYIRTQTTTCKAVSPTLSLKVQQTIHVFIIILKVVQNHNFVVFIQYVPFRTYTMISNLQSSYNQISPSNIILTLFDMTQPDNHSNALYIYISCDTNIFSTTITTISTQMMCQLKMKIETSQNERGYLKLIMQGCLVKIRKLIERPVVIRDQDRKILVHKLKSSRRFTVKLSDQRKAQNFIVVTHIKFLHKFF